MRINISDLNTSYRDDPAAFIASADAAYEQQMIRVASDIRDHRREKPVVLLAGPSGSGKTTTALVLEQMLDGWGYEAHTLSMDNYFLPFSQEERALAAAGKIDLESPARMDIPFLNAQLSDIIAGRPVDIPKYDFKTSTRVSSGWTLQRKAGELVILEGIHALNPEVITIPDAQTAKLYVSVRTRVQCGDLTLHPSKIRLLRRMLRDRAYRSRPAGDTLQLYPGVQHGENVNILPYKERANYDVDTFIGYEAGVYKPMLLPELQALAGRQAVDELLRVLEHVDAVPETLVPGNSLIREFIGGSAFHY